MHCEDPGCLRACPADGAIIKYENGIVDFQQEHCIGCGYCISGCPFDIPKFNPKTNKVFKCTLCSDRVGQGLEPACIKACPTGCLHFGTKHDMVQIAAKRVGIRKRRRLRSTVDWRHACHLRAARHHETGVVRWLAFKSGYSSELHDLEVAGETYGFADGCSRRIRGLFPSHYCWSKTAAT